MRRKDIQHVVDQLRAVESCVAAVYESQTCGPCITAKWAARELRRVCERDEHGELGERYDMMVVDGACSDCGGPMRRGEATRCVPVVGTGGYRFQCMRCAAVAVLGKDTQG